MSSAAETIQAKTLIVNITKKKVGIRRKVSRQAVEVTPVETGELNDREEPERTEGEAREGIDQDLLHVSKDLYESPVLEDIKTLYSKVNNRISAIALPATTLKSGMYLIKAANVGIVEELMNTAKERLRVLVDTFVEAYPTLVEESKKKLGSLANDRDYPNVSRIRDFFVMEWQYLTFDAPRRALQEVNQEILLREESKIKAQLAGYATQIESALITSLNETIKHFMGVLSPEEGKQKRVTEARVERFNSIIETIMGKNIGDNEELTRLATLAKDVLNGNTPDEINKNVSIKQLIETRMQEVQASLEQMIVEKETRRIIIEQE